MSWIVEFRPEGKRKYEKVTLPDKVREYLLRGLQPNKNYELREADRKGARTQVCKANENGEITLVFFILGFECY